MHRAFEVREAGRLPRAGDVLWLPVEPEMVLGERGGAAGGSEGAEVSLRESHRKGGVGREIEGSVAFAQHLWS